MKDFFNNGKRKQEREINYLSQKEIKRLFEAIKNSENKFKLRDLALFTVIYLGWLRASEVKLLKASDYRPEVKELFIRRLKGSNSNTIRIIDDEKRRLLNKYIKEYSGKELYKINSENDYLFKWKNGKPLDLEAIRFLFKQYWRLAKLPKEKQHPHILKHSIAVHLAESGIDIKDLQYYLGHKNINNTTIYFQYTTKQMDNFYNKLSQNNELA